MEGRGKMRERECKKKLNCTGNSLGMETCTVLGDALKTNTSLTDLDLDCNK